MRWRPRRRATAGASRWRGGRSSEEDLLRGRLIAPFDLKIPRERAWCLVYPKNVRKQKVELFRDWIHEEARDVPYGVGGATPFNLD